VIFLVWNYCLSRSILNGGKHLTIWQEWRKKVEKKF
jgi:hypothetical protein